MFAEESGEPIAPNGSVPMWKVTEKVTFHGSWHPALVGQECKVIGREWTGTYWTYRVRRAATDTEPDVTVWAVEPELRCVRHNERGSTEHAGRKRRVYCSCGMLVRTEWDDE